jgi:hypothetical protein
MRAREAHLSVRFDGATALLIIGLGMLEALGKRLRNVALALALGAVACSSPAIECRVSTEDYRAPDDGTVTYAASVTGAGAIKAVVYLAAGTSVNENSPQVPFDKAVPVASGAPISFTVYGSIENGAAGNVLAAFEFLGAAAGDSYQSNASCR